MLTGQRTFFNAYHPISNLMSANLLVLNPTKTEFLLISGPQQLSELISHSLPLTADISMTQVHFSRNLGFIVDYHSQSCALSKACFYHIRYLSRRLVQTCSRILCDDQKTAAGIRTKEVLVLQTTSQERNTLSFCAIAKSRRCRSVENTNTTK